MAVEIEWIDSISAAATGNKIYRDTVPSTGEVEIADIAKGVQFYSDATAAPGTEYKYEVQAHDGAGDETTQEVEGENMDYITTAGGTTDYFPQDNAASVADIDSVGTFASYSDTFVTSDTDSHDGNYSIKIESSKTGYQNGSILLDLPIGTYTLKFWAKVNTDNEQKLYLNAANQGWDSVVTININALVWTEYTVEVTNVVTEPGLVFYSGEGGGAIGDTLWIDLVTVEPV